MKRENAGSWPVFVWMYNLPPWLCMKRKNAGSWDSGLEKEQILETYSAQLQKS